MRRALIAFLFILPTFAFAQGTWTPLQGGGCIGGATCSEKRIRIALEDRPVLAVRLTAHDNIGPRKGGAVRVKIDGNTIENFDAVKREPRVYQYEVDELRGRFLIVEAAENDEIEVSQIAVLYAPREGRGTIRRIPREGGGWDRSNSNGGWRRYAQADACIGGSECRKNGNRITIALDDRPVLGVRFWASDEIGPKAGGVLNVRIDDTTVASYIDIKRDGRRHEFDVDNVEGSRLVIETGSNDEVDVKEIEVLYARGGRRSGGNYGSREITHEGGCIGGVECGGNRARIRVALNGRPVQSIRLYAHDEVGPKAGGELRIRIDDQIVEYALDVKREGRTVTIDGKGLAGDYLYIEPATNDEVVVKDVRVTLADD